MKKSESLKKIVKEKYGQIATAKPGCGCGCECNTDDSIFTAGYDNLQGYVQEADLGLGCGIPTEHAGLKTSDSVLDLGSGAGNDCFVARAIVGDTGKVTGLDFTDEMIRKAIVNNEKLGYGNVEFVKGDIENMPLPDNTYDVIISNCVLNLVPDKQKAFSEIYRVLKPGGHFCVSDIVLKGSLPKKLEEAAELYTGCVSGALQKDEYIKIIESTGFNNIEIKDERQGTIPNEVLLNYISSDEIDRFHKSGTGIFSITITAYK